MHGRGHHAGRRRHLLVATDRAFTLADNARYGARNLLLAMSTLNLGDDAGAAAAAGVLPNGLMLNQRVLDRLLKGNAGPGIPAVETLILNARDSVNVFGSVTLDATQGQGVGRLVLGAPAIYGYGGAADTATIRSRELVWTGVSARPSDLSGQYDPAIPGAAIATGWATAGCDWPPSASCSATADTQPVNWLSAQRLALGFAGVDLLAGERVTANGQGHAQGLSPPGRVPGGQGYAYSGGDLNIVTPLLTGEASASMATAGGSLTLRRPQGAAALPGQAGALGAQLTLAGGSVDLDGAIALASGKLKIEAERDLRLGAQSRLDLAGREVVFYDQTRYTWGGDLTLDSASGNIDQEVGSVIDLSARKQRGGTLAATALAPAPVGSTCAVPFWAARPACTTQAARACRMTPPRSRCGHGRWPTSPD